ncbi:MAG: PQQ-binding-like beta-propeller repeat protein [Planctomycetota bacterium]|nr:PQQ-binding-like beta-propeller repeat protein [Planctomycetota bacterium]
MRSYALQVLVAMILAFPPVSLSAADWTQFRGQGGLGVSAEMGLPLQWSSGENVVWKTEMPGPGASSPIALGDRVFITCYSGYGLEPGAGDQQELVRHLLCLNRRSGEVNWHQQFQPKLPEHKYQGEGSYHGYAASTPTTDGQRLYVFFGKSGVFCFDLDGEELWQASVGEGTNGWGSGCSPLLYKNLLIVNASVESGSLVALDKTTGEEVWRATGINSSWNTPLLVPGKQNTELVVSISDHVLSFNPDTGEELWRAEGVHHYVCPSVVYHDDVVFAIGGGHTSLAVRTGGSGDVTESHGVWRLNKGANVSSPVYYEGHLYWTRDGSTACCQNPATGEMVYEERIQPGAGQVWSSPVLADGKLFYVSQQHGTYVVAAKPKFELLAHNVFEDDDSRTNASPAVSDGQLLLRTDRRLYCIGAK